MKKALIVIDVQNDYFPNGSFSLWNTETVLTNIERAIQTATEKNIPVIHVQHVADKSRGMSPFFNEGTEGVQIHSRIMASAPNSPVVVKHAADSFHETDLEKVLSDLGIKELLVCGMMTQNCVTHTAISKAAEKYKVKVLADCCTTVNEMIHLIALNALTTRIDVVPYTEAI